MDLRENDRLKEENKRFMDTLRELRSSIYDVQKNVREAWEEIMDRQIEINSEAGGGIRDFFRQMKGGEKEV
jgi:predicted nucleotide-binding protein (sugar kinase/HSP70/actin superfamily)